MTIHPYIWPPIDLDEEIPMSQKSEDERQAIEAMIQYGGGFVHNLGKAWAHADPHNRVRLNDAFPDLLEEYKAKFVKEGT